MKEKRKILMAVIVILMLVSIAGVGGYYWYQNTYYVISDDARITGDLYRITPQVTGKLLELNIGEGDYVKEGQIIARQEMINIPDYNVEMSVIKSPISGTVLKKSANEGEVLAPGQIIAIVTDLNKVYVTANIEESKLYKVGEGQKVDVFVDSFPGHVFEGRVFSIGQATTSTFSILPTTTGGTYTKVVQRIPVKIHIIDKIGKALLPGMNTEVKIHIK